MSSDQSPIVTNVTNVVLYVENTEPAEGIYYVEIIISPYPVIGIYNPFAFVILITQPELAMCTTQNISPLMCTVSAGDDHSDNTGNKNNFLKN